MSPVVPSGVLARITSAAVLGIDAYLVDVETDIAGGLPSFVTVGLPQGAVKEGRERVNAAINSSQRRPDARASSESKCMDLLWIRTRRASR